MGAITDAGVTILMAIIGVAILSVLVSRKSQTIGVIQAASSGFSNALGMAMTPVSGTSAGINTGYPTSSLGGMSFTPQGFGV
jgi:PRD1 phage membrane DNA delivery